MKYRAKWCDGGLLWLELKNRKAIDQNLYKFRSSILFETLINSIVLIKVENTLKNKKSIIYLHPPTQPRVASAGKPAEIF